MLFGHIVESNSGILGSKAACAYPKLIAACHALHRFLSQGIHQLPFGRIVLLGSFEVILGITPPELFIRNALNVSDRGLNISPELNAYTPILSNGSSFRVLVQNRTW